MRCGAISKTLHPLRRQHQLLADAGLHRRVAGIGNDHVLRLGPGAGELVGAANGAHHVVAALDDDPGEMPDIPDPGDQIAVPAKEVVAEEIGLDSRQAQRQASSAPLRNSHHEPR